MYRNGISATKCEMCVLGEKKEEVEKAGAANQEKDETPRDGGSAPSISLSRASTVGRAAE